MQEICNAALCQLDMGRKSISSYKPVAETDLRNWYGPVLQLLSIATTPDHFLMGQNVFYLWHMISEMHREIL
jgi:hypothetical protein